MTTDIDRIDLHPPEPKLDGRYLDDLIALWLEHCAGRLGATTLIGYEVKVVHFRRWWSETGPATGWILRRTDMERFEVYLRAVEGKRTQTELSYHSRNDILRRLRQMFRWAYENHYTSRDYSLWVPPADGEPLKRKVATHSTLERLFLAAGRSLFPHRDQAILALLIGTGVRRSECASLRVSDVKFFGDNSGVALVRGKRTRKNKTGVREIGFDAATGNYIRAYLRVQELSDGPLFRSAWGPTKGRKLTSMGMYKVVKRLITDAGLDDLVQGCHDLRRAFATHLAKQVKKNETASDILRRQLGHASYAMTSQYTLLEGEDMRASLQGQLVSPMARIAPSNGDTRLRVWPD